MPARCDPILYPDTNTVELRIRGDDDVETTIEWGWEQTLHLGADLIETALAAKRRQGDHGHALAGPAGGVRE